MGRSRRPLFLTSKAGRAWRPVIAYALRTGSDQILRNRGAHLSGARQRPVSPSDTSRGRPTFSIAYADHAELARGLIPMVGRCRAGGSSTPAMPNERQPDPAFRRPAQGGTNP